MSDLPAILDLLRPVWDALTPQERDTVFGGLTGSPGPFWTPYPGPQIAALSCQADELFFGGGAGGGKTDILLGLALTQHWTSIIFRREYPQLKAIIERTRRLIGDKGQYNSQNFTWRLKDGRYIELGACKEEKDVERYQGRPHDFIGFDEVSHLSRSQYIFLTGWNRPADSSHKVRCRIVATGNPPTNPAGRWVVEEWAPWLEKQFPEPAEPGELRWYAREDDGTILWSKTPDLITLKKGYAVKPKSRTFIPARVDDNPTLMAAGYKTVLQGLHEPRRSQMLYGDFSAGLQDDAMQVIPTAWVQAAQGRWTEGGRDCQLSCVGVDPARGGKDQSTISKRYGTWFGQIAKYKGTETPDGPALARLVTSQAIEAPDVPVQIDVIGIGAAVYDVLRQGRGNYRGVVFSQKCQRRDRTGQLTFVNLRAYAYWKLREALDPDLGEGLALPPDPELLADLTAPRWQERPNGILVESKDDIRKRLGRSTDCGDAVVLAWLPPYSYDLPADAFIEVPGRHGPFDDSRPSSAKRRGFLGLSDTI